MLRRLVRLILPKSLAHRLATAVRAWRRKCYPAREVEHVYCGEKLKVYIGDSMAEGWYDHDWTEGMLEIEWLARRRLCQGARVFDIGAHQGVVALLLSRRVGPAGSVLAVEAYPWNAKVAAINRDLNSAQNVTVLNTAVADVDKIPDHSTSAVLDRVLDWSQQNVPFRCIDSLEKEYGHPDVVYIDVDGFEVKVLQGAASVLDGRTDWFVEVHVGCGLEEMGGTWQDVLAFFPPANFERFISSDRAPGFLPFCEDSPLLTARFYLVANGKAGMPVRP